MRFTPTIIPGLVLASLALQVGCEPTYNYVGYDMPDHFPLDGSERGWTYASTDTTIATELQVEKVPQSSVQDGMEVVVLEHWLVGEDDTEDLAWSVKWASDQVEGVMIYGFKAAADEEWTEFTPPIQFADKSGITGDQVITQSGSYTWTATFQSVEGCETYWVPDWADEDCLVVNLDDGDDTPVTNGIIVGTYWLVPRWGAALMELDAYDARWSLLDTDWAE